MAKRKIDMTIALVSFLFLILISCQQAEKQEIDLSGEWSYQLDKNEIGETEKWYNADFSNQLILPGALRDYEIGDEPTLTTNWTGSIYDSSWYFNPAMEKYRQEGDVKFPFWLTPKKHFKGMAWFQKEFSIPSNWNAKDVVLFLERPHWQTKVWVDSLEIGTDNSLSVPHSFVIPASLLSNGTHRLTIRVDNEIRDLDPGINSHSISDHTQGNWNGIIGEIKMYPQSDIYLKKVKVTPLLASQSVEIEVELNQSLPNAKLNFDIQGKNHNHQLQKISKVWEDGNNTMTFTVPMDDDFKTWSEFSPNIYELVLTLEEESNILDQKKVPFGMREFTINDKHFAINGTQVFLRGTTECSVFPLTGYPPTDVDEWKRIFDINKSFGLNHMRFHSYCPPEAAFIAADEAGIYLQVEGPSWAKYSTTLGYGLPIDDYLMEETKRILDTYGNHPSFVMMAYGNEPSGRYVEYLDNWVEHFRDYDSRFVYTGASTGSSWSVIENSDFVVRASPRGLAWGSKQPESLFDYRDKTENQQRPYVTFEMGQWCVFPNFDEIDKYTGSLEARNFELFREHLSDKNMGDQSQDFLMASGKLQALSYKQEIEATLRTPNLAGFQLLSLNDFSGQGTALVGVLDAFWDEKGYISSSEFSSFSNKVVPLIRINKYTFESNETLEAQVEIANFSGGKLENSNISWKLVNESGVEVKNGSFDAITIPVGNCHEVGTVQIPLNFVEQANQFNLSVSINEYENNWNIWVYPNTLTETKTEDIVIAHQMDQKVLDALDNGEKVLLLVSDKVENGKDIVQYFTPVFWNTSWFRMRPPHTLGLLVQNTHPVFSDFPTNYYSDFQWWEIVNNEQVMNIDNFPADFKPLIQPIDTWFLNRKLAMLFEAKVGNGTIMVCSADLTTDIDNRYAARQLKYSILQYMNSDKFSPSDTVDYSVINELFEVKERDVWNSYVSDNP